MPFSISNPFRAYLLMDHPNCHWPHPLQFLRMWWYVLIWGTWLYFVIEFWLSIPWIFVSPTQLLSTCWLISFPKMSSFKVHTSNMNRFESSENVSLSIQKSIQNALWYVLPALHSFHPYFGGSSIHNWSCLFQFMKAYRLSFCCV